VNGVDEADLVVGVDTHLDTHTQSSPAQPPAQTAVTTPACSGSWAVASTTLPIWSSGQSGALASGTDLHFCMN
jgi:hypothetical protein